MVILITAYIRWGSSFSIFLKQQIAFLLQEVVEVLHLEETAEERTAGKGNRPVQLEAMQSS